MEFTQYNYEDKNNTELEINYENDIGMNYSKLPDISDLLNGNEMLELPIQTHPNTVNSSNNVPSDLISTVNPEHFPFSSFSHPTNIINPINISNPVNNNSEYEANACDENKQMLEILPYFNFENLIEDLANIKTEDLEKNLLDLEFQKKKPKRRYRKRVKKNFDSDNSSHSDEWHLPRKYKRHKIKKRMMEKEDVTRVMPHNERVKFLRCHKIFEDWIFHQIKSTGELLVLDTPNYRNHNNYSFCSQEVIEELKSIQDLSEVLNKILERQVKQEVTQTDTNSNDLEVQNLKDFAGDNTNSENQSLIKSTEKRVSKRKQQLIPVEYEADIMSEEIDTFEDASSDDLNCQMIEYKEEIIIEYKEEMTENNLNNVIEDISEIYIKSDYTDIKTNASDLEMKERGVTSTSYESCNDFDKNSDICGKEVICVDAKLFDDYETSNKILVVMTQDSIIENIGRSDNDVIVEYLNEDTVDSDIDDILEQPQQSENCNFECTNHSDSTEFIVENETADNIFKLTDENNALENVKTDYFNVCYKDSDKQTNNFTNENEQYNSTVKSELLASYVSDEFGQDNIKFELINCCDNKLTGNNISCKSEISEMSPKNVKPNNDEIESDISPDLSSIEINKTQIELHTTSNNNDESVISVSSESSKENNIESEVFNENKQKKVSQWISHALNQPETSKKMNLVYNPFCKKNNVKYQNSLIVPNPFARNKHIKCYRNKNKCIQTSCFKTKAELKYYNSSDESISVFKNSCSDSEVVNNDYSHFVSDIDNQDAIESSESSVSDSSIDSSPVGVSETINHVEVPKDLLDAGYIGNTRSPQDKLSNVDIKQELTNSQSDEGIMMSQDLFSNESQSYSPIVKIENETINRKTDAHNCSSTYINPMQGSTDKKSHIEFIRDLNTNTNVKIGTQQLYERRNIANILHDSLFLNKKATFLEEVESICRNKKIKIEPVEYSNKRKIKTEIKDLLNSTANYLNTFPANVGRINVYDRIKLRSSSLDSTLANKRSNDLPYLVCTRVKQELISDDELSTTVNIPVQKPSKNKRKKRVYYDQYFGENSNLETINFKSEPIIRPQKGDTCAIDVNNIIDDDIHITRPLTRKLAQSLIELNIDTINLSDRKSKELSKGNLFNRKSKESNKVQDNKTKKNAIGMKDKKSQIKSTLNKFKNITTKFMGKLKKSYAEKPDNQDKEKSSKESKSKKKKLVKKEKDKSFKITKNINKKEQPVKIPVRRSLRLQEAIILKEKRESVKVDSNMNSNDTLLLPKKEATNFDNRMCEKIEAKISIDDILSKKQKEIDEDLEIINQYKSTDLTEIYNTSTIGKNEMSRRSKVFKSYKLEDLNDESILPQRRITKKKKKFNFKLPLTRRHYVYIKPIKNVFKFHRRKSFPAKICTVTQKYSNPEFDDKIETLTAKNQEKSLNLKSNDNIIKNVDIAIKEVSTKYNLRKRKLDNTENKYTRQEQKPIRNIKIRKRGVLVNRINNKNKKIHHSTLLKSIGCTKKRYNSFKNKSASPTKKLKIQLDVKQPKNQTDSTDISMTSSSSDLVDYLMQPNSHGSFKRNYDVYMLTQVVYFNKYALLENNKNRFFNFDFYINLKHQHEDSLKMAEMKSDEDKTSETPQILVAVIPDGTFAGIKYKPNVNEISDSEERRVHMLETIRNILKFKVDLEEGVADVNDFKSSLIIKPHLSITQRIKILEAHIMKYRSRKLDWLRIESKLIKLEGEIKSHLGLEKANTKLALQCLNQIDELQIEQLMLVKHPFVIDVIKRLRRYIGNLQLWGLSPAETKAFLSDSENIRNKADEIYQKFKELFTIEAGQTFADVYQAKIRDFKANIKDLSETDRFTLCEWPGTPKFLHDRIIDNLLSELEQLRRRLFETNNIRQ